MKNEIKKMMEQANRIDEKLAALELQLQLESAKKAGKTEVAFTFDTTDDAKKRALTRLELDGYQIESTPTAVVIRWSE